MTLDGEPALADLARGPDRLIGPTILASGGLLALGWLLPIMTVEKLLFLDERISILEGAWALWEAGHGFLFAIIVVFSILFPLAKLGGALLLWYGVAAGSPGLAQALGWLEAFGRWSMLDVFVVALTVVAIEVSLINDVTLHVGLYLFTAGILLSIAVVARIARIARRQVERTRTR